MTAKFSRHVNEQHNRTEHALAMLRDLRSTARSFKMTQQDYLTRREALYHAMSPKLTRESLAYVRGYDRAASDAVFRGLFHVRRIAGKPETASAASWDDMTEELRQACRDHDTESCLAWDEKGAHPYSPWAHE